MEFEGVSPRFKQIHLINHHLSTNYNIMHVIFLYLFQWLKHISKPIYIYIYINKYNLQCQLSTSRISIKDIPTLDEFPGTLATPWEISGCNSQRAGKRRSRGCAWWSRISPGMHEKPTKTRDLTIQNCGWMWLQYGIYLGFYGIFDGIYIYIYLRNASQGW